MCVFGFFFLKEGGKKILYNWGMLLENDVWIY